MKVFNPIRDHLSKNIEVSEFEVPEYRGLPWHSLKNIWFVHNHIKKGCIHHVTGLTELALGCCHKKTVITFHDANFMVNTKNPISKFLKYLLRIYLPVKISDCVTCISETTKHEILKYVKANIHVIYNPVNPQYKPYYKQFNISCPTILHIGTGWNKNLQNVIKALNGITCHLRIIGKLSDEDIVLLNKNKINYSNGLNLTDNEILNEYRKCDIVSFPSIYEGFGMPIIEGQAIGRCVITSNINPMVEIAGTAAVFVSPQSVMEIHNAFLKVILDQNFRNDLIKKGFENINRFKLEKICNEYMNVYKNLIYAKKYCDNK